MVLEMLHAWQQMLIIISLPFLCGTSVQVSIYKPAHTNSWEVWRDKTVPNVLKTKDCTTLNPSPPLSQLSSRFSQIFASYITLPNPHFISALLFHSPCTPSPCVVSIFPRPSLSQPAICWRWQITAALWNHSWWHWTRFIWHSDDVRPGTAWPRHCKNTAVLGRSGGLVSATACFNYSWQRHTWKCQCLCVVSSISWINSCSPSLMEEHLHAAE